MDFKVAGTEDGHHRVPDGHQDRRGQLGDPVPGAGRRPGKAGCSILEIMDRTIREPRESISDYAPKIITLKIDQEKIGAVIGPGGKIIKGITEKHRRRDQHRERRHRHHLLPRQGRGRRGPRSWSRAWWRSREVGRWYTGTVRRIMDFGAFVEFMPGKEGLVHISRMAQERVNAVTRRAEGRPGGQGQALRDRPHGPPEPEHDRAARGLHRRAPAAPAGPGPPGRRLRPPGRRQARGRAQGRRQTARRGKAGAPTGDSP